MSRAFVKELEDAPEREPALRPAAEPAPITSRGQERLAGALAAASDPAERRRLEEILARVYVVPPPEDRTVAAFGATVSVSGAAGDELRRFTIVGPDEVDIPAGNIGPDSPLAQALLGARAGDDVVWQRPAGDRKLTVRRIEYS
jgi:transcription elongation GreA/GreB family factor